MHKMDESFKTLLQKLGVREAGMEELTNKAINNLDEFIDIDEKDLCDAVCKHIHKKITDDLANLHLEDDGDVYKNIMKNSRRFALKRVSMDADPFVDDNKPTTPSTTREMPAEEEEARSVQSSQ